MAPRRKSGQQNRGAATPAAARAGDPPVEGLRQVQVPRTYMVIVDQIRELVDSGALAPGDKLPTERVLAEQLGVSRASMREALTALEVMGLIDSRPGSGNYVAEVISEDALNTQFASLIAEGGTNEILETRGVFEPGVAALAAQRRTAEDLDAMRSCMAAMERHVERAEDSWEADWGFHRAVAAACQNPTILAVVDLFTERMASPLWQVMRDRNLAADPGRAAQYLSDHQRIHQAIADGDSQAAAERMQAHVTRIVEDLAAASQDLGDGESES